MDQVPFAKRTACEHLNGINSAHVGFDNGDDLLILSMGSNLTQGNLRRTDAQGKPGTLCPWKSFAFRITSEVISLLVI